VPVPESSGLGGRGIFRALRLPAPPSTLLATLCQLSSLPLELLLIREGLRATLPGFRNFVELPLVREDLGEDRGDEDEECASFSPDDLLSESVVGGGDGLGAVGLGGGVILSSEDDRELSVITEDLFPGKDLRDIFPSLLYR